jgi:hypothetical protein
MFTKGQVLVYKTSRHDDTGYLVKVRTVWKNGVVAVTYLNSGSLLPGTFFADGRRRGEGYGYHTSFIEPLPEGTTVESFTAAKQAKDAASKKAGEHRVLEHRAAVARWWAETGARMWAERAVLPMKLLGEEVCAIQFVRRDETYLPLLVVRRYIDEFTKKNEVTITVAGLAGTTSQRGEASYTNINGFSQSTARESTLEECLYQIGQ